MHSTASHALNHASISLAAFLSPDCSAGTSGGSCNLNGLLHLLYVIAAVLGAILVLVIAFAVHAWRKTKATDLTRQ